MAKKSAAKSSTVAAVPVPAALTNAAARVSESVTHMLNLLQRSSLQAYKEVLAAMDALTGRPALNAVDGHLLKASHLAVQGFIDVVDYQLAEVDRRLRADARQS